MPPRPTVRGAVPAPPLTIAVARSFFVLTETRVFPAMMSLRTLLKSVLVRCLTRRYEWNGVTLIAASVGGNFRWLLRSPAFPQISRPVRA
jgi:hypothetical protein